MPKFVCPMPMHWNRIYQRLKRAYESRNLESPPPPIPLILNGWISSNDAEKHVRWLDTLEWASKNGLIHLIHKLTPEQEYRVIEFTTYNVGPLGGPMYLPWNFAPREVPKKEAVEVALEKLRENWAEVAGRELSGRTWPFAITGRKFRRLLVKANPAFTPPWGGWKYLAQGERRREFTRLRRAVNESIRPLEVDHICFKTSNWSGQLPET